jgi:hypothetical protein
VSDEAARRAAAERALKNAAEHGAVGDSFLAKADRPATAEGGAIDRWGMLIGRGLALAVAAVLLWYFLGAPPF